MRVVLDAMGGDFAPKVTVEGAVKALNANKELFLILTGDQAQIDQELKQYDTQEIASRMQIVHTPEVVGMDEDPLKAFTEKKNSSLAVGFGLVVQGKADVFASAGNSGAVMAGSHYIVKPIEGVKRPCVISVLPRPNGERGVLVDVGINVDAKPENFPQLAQIASLYAERVYGIANPKVGLLNIGEEEGKGNKQAKEAFDLLKESEAINFVGNIEGNDVFYQSAADVVLCDGFMGNVILKMIESIYEVMDKDLGLKHEYIQSFNYESYGGTPILGVNHNVILGHGKSSAEAIANMIHTAHLVAKSDMAAELKKAIS